MPIEVKICGLSDPEGVDAAIAAGADYLGFVLFPKSPRNVSLARAAELAGRARGRTRIVALTVDAPDTALSDIAAALRPDLLQLHGSETAERVASVRQLLRRPVMKAVGIASRDDVSALGDFAADRLLLDAKAPADAALPGGNGARFDWSILQGFSTPLPWFLAGGLDPGNVGAAVRAARPSGVDVSSGVESAPGQKNPELIRAFVAAVRAAEGSPVARSTEFKEVNA